MHARRYLFHSTLVAVAVLGLATLGYAQTANDQPQSGTMMGQHSQMMGGQGAPQEPEQGTPPWMQQQREWFQKRLQERREADQRLDSLVEKMNSATGNAKIDAMQAVIDELVKQRDQRESWWNGMGYGMGPGMMGYGMGPAMMGSGMGHESWCPCRQQAQQQDNGSTSGGSR